MKFHLTPEGGLIDVEARRVERLRWIRRQAMQIVVQLPEEEADALAVLENARQLVKPV